MGNYIEDLIYKSSVNPNWERDEDYEKAFYLTQRLGLYESFMRNFKNIDKMTHDKFLYNFGLFMLCHGYEINYK